MTGTWDALQLACDVALPAWASAGDNSTRRQCFLARLSNAPEGGRLLTLNPVASPLGLGRVVLDLCCGGENLQVTGSVIREVGAEAQVLLRRPPVARPPRARRIQPGLDRIVCSFIPEGLGLGRCHQPVWDISARGLTLVSGVPLPVGTPLRDVVVVSHATQLRHAEGTVQSCIPLLLLHGRRAWRCGVLLRNVGEGRPAPGTEDAELTDPERVRTILWGLADLRSEVVVHVGTQTLPAVLLLGEGSRDHPPAFTAQLLQPAPAPVPLGVVHVATNLFGSGYHFMARLKPQGPHHLVLRPAGILRQVFRREDARINLLHEPTATITWSHPLEGTPQQHRLLDLGVDGFGMEVDPAAFGLWTGLPLRDVHLELPGQAFDPQGAVVRAINGRRVGVRMAPLPPDDADRLRLTLVQRSHPALTFHDGRDLDAILAFHRKVKLLEPAMEENLAAALPETRRTWAAAHQHPQGLMRTALGRRGEDVNATLTLVRAYDTSWALQHAAVLHPTVQPTPGTLHGALSSLVYPRPDGEYLFGYLADDVPSQHALMDAFLNTASTPEHRGRQTFHVLAGRSVAQPAAPRDPDIHRIPLEQEALVENAALRVLDPVCASALALRAGQVTLPQSRQAFASAGLTRGREALGVWRNGLCVGLLLREWASPGLCLSSMLNAAMYLPVFEHADPDGAARRKLLALALSLPLHGAPPWRLVLVPEPWDVEVAAPVGLTRMAGCTLYAFHRHGQREYHHYVASRYGLLHARLGHRGEAA